MAYFILFCLISFLSVCGYFDNRAKINREQEEINRDTDRERAEKERMQAEYENRMKAGEKGK